MKEKITTKNALIMCKTSTKGFKNLVARIELENGDVVECEIKLNPYDKKVLNKLSYKVALNVPTYEK